MAAIPPLKHGGPVVSRLFEELDYRPTPIGALSLRRRLHLTTGADIYEIKLGDDFLMSSQFTASEIALARLAIDAHGGRDLDVCVGGLGLGYTAKAVLDYDTVASLVVVEFLDAVIDWHRSGLLPIGSTLASDKRCRLVSGDFFEMAGSGAGFDRENPNRTFDAVLVDIDHSPDMLLSERSRPFYRTEGLRGVAHHLKSGGIFGLWSNERPDPAFVAQLTTVFAE